MGCFFTVFPQQIPTFAPYSFCANVAHQNITMTTQEKLRWRIELLSWLLSALVALLVVMPIWQYFISYKFLYANILFVVLFLHFSRYTFLLPYSPLAQVQPLKFALIFICIPLIFHQVELIQNFQIFLDDEGLAGFDEHFKPGLHTEQQQKAIAYVQREFFFFGVSSIIVSVLMPFRLLLSYWRVYNKTGKV
jgi:hypothetical protein